MTKIKYYDVIILSKRFGIEDMPSWMYNLDHGTDFVTGYTDLSVPKNKINKIKVFFRKNKIKLRISKLKETEW